MAFAALVGQKNWNNVHIHICIITDSESWRQENASTNLNEKAFYVTCRMVESLKHGGTCMGRIIMKFKKSILNNNNWPGSVG
ncbi:protein of unknown function [Mesotoga infera]|uniref:Uncharacterized protein n=1 Tax=Mesotoga infera TaxID=1236046 RepID=A0A7Z7LGK3_9BACT|nr:protein of unknown function [Mesotoga infera]